MSVKEWVDTKIAADPVVVFGKSYCPFCKKALAAFDSIEVKPKCYDLEDEPEMDAIQDYLKELTGGRSVPRVFIKQKFYGGGDETAAGAKNGELKKLIVA